MSETIMEACERVAAAMTKLEIAQLRAKWPNNPAVERDGTVSVKPRKKHIAIDIGTSGAWLVERETGEIFNIKGYGVPDRNKKAKSDIGNIQTVDPARMLAMEYNYLR